MNRCLSACAQATDLLLTIITRLMAQPPGIEPSSTDLQTAAMTTSAKVGLMGFLKKLRHKTYTEDLLEPVAYLVIYPYTSVPLVLPFQGGFTNRYSGSSSQDRTVDLLHVKELRYRCAKELKWNIFELIICLL